ncbi:uncharacterized protein CDAR_621861 [Caerostris darwini]|uniref:Secreted protein n=1 Tax=Caerostris darwini TaxID=1538125 RepID=A0AAV4P844_9ARAC|nr:uncharacterized protein CDAR_621861 [Caerostris darwini]
MKAPVLCLFLMIGGSLAFLRENCDSSKCESLSTVREIESLRFMPNEEQLNRLCPRTIQYMNCLIETMETCAGQTLEQLSTTGNATVAPIAKLIIDVRTLFNELCDESSTLHKEYVANIECIRGYIPFGPRQCRQQVGVIAADLLQNIDIGEDNDVKLAERTCLVDTFEIGCVVIGLGRECGDGARELLASVLLRIKDSVIAQIDCKNVPDTLGVKDKFLDALDLNDDERSKFEIAFELTRNRRR